MTPSPASVFNYSYTTRALTKETVIRNESGSHDACRIIDPTALERLHRLGGDGLIVKMIDLFFSHTEPVLVQALASFEAGEFEGVERAAHSLKSSAGNVGAQEVRYLAEEIELLAPTANKSILQPLLANLQQALIRAKARLEQERS